MTVERSAAPCLRTCIACGSSDLKLAERWLGYELARCSLCGVTFTVNPDYNPDLYVAAYEKAESGTPLPEDLDYIYHAPENRLAMECSSWLLPPPRLTLCERAALRWVTRRAPKRAVVMDCGCGTGRFLRMLHGTGLRGVGIEVSESLVGLLRQSGLEAIHGAAPGFTWGGPPPFAMTFFEVLEHLPEPAAMIGELRRRFPGMSIVASVPAPNRASLALGGERGVADYPPHHFIRWTPDGLLKFFRQGGYDVEVLVPGPVGSELMPGLSQVLAPFRNLRGSTQKPALARRAEHSVWQGPRKSVRSTLILWAHRGFQIAMDCIGARKAAVARARGASSSSMLALATPCK